MHVQVVADVWRVQAEQEAESSSDRNDSQHNSTVGGAPNISPWCWRVSTPVQTVACRIVHGNVHNI